MAKVVLANPIKVGDAEIKEIELRTPKAGELRGLRLSELLNGEVSSIATVVERVSTPTLTRDKFDELTVADLAALSTEVLSFFVDGPKMA